MRVFTLLFLRRDDELLLAMKKRGFGVGHWNGVGGKVEAGETVEDAVVRECQEEIGVTPRALSKVAEITFDEMHEGGRESIQAHVFTASDWEGEPAESEEMAPEWFNIAAIPYGDMWADDPYWLPQVVAGKKLRCHFQLNAHDQVVSKTVQEVDAW